MTITENIIGNDLKLKQIYITRLRMFMQIYNLSSVI